MKVNVSKKRFTLIELLAVMAIASVLIAVAAPAFSRMLLGSKADRYASSLRTGMEMAQAKAIASRKYVAMVLPGNMTEPGDDAAKKKFRQLKQFVNGGYRLACVKNTGTVASPSFEFVSWFPDEEWRNPADGAMLVRVATSTGDAVIDEGRDIDDDLKNLTSFTGTDDDLTALSSPKALIFSPYGGLASTSTNTLYFVVTETSVAGGAYKYGNTDDKQVLKLNPITGRVSYLE